MASSELKGRGWAYLQTGAAAAALQLAVGLDSVNVHMPSGPQLAASRCSPARDSKFDSLPALSSLLPTANLPLIASLPAGAKDGKLAGRDAFTLWDTYGFPVDLTEVRVVAFFCCIVLA